MSALFPPIIQRRDTTDPDEAGWMLYWDTGDRILELVLLDGCEKLQWWYRDRRSGVVDGSMFAEEPFSTALRARAEEMFRDWVRTDAAREGVKP